jgi:hypothetical protein
MDARKVWAAGVREDPERLHNLTATVLLALTNMLPANPASIVDGQPGAIESPGLAPVRTKVSCAQEACAIDPNESELAAVR